MMSVRTSLKTISVRSSRQLMRRFVHQVQPLCPLYGIQSNAIQYHRSSSVCVQKLNHSNTAIRSVHSRKMGIKDIAIRQQETLEMPKQWEGNMTHNDKTGWTMSKLQELGITVKISNVFAVFDLQTQVDLKHIALSARNAEFKPRNGFKYVLIRYREPKGTVMIYRSGKVLVLGSTSLENAMIIAKKTCSMLQKLEIEAQMNRFRIVNLLMSSDVKFRIRLEGLARDHAKFCTYEPELFPGLIYRVVDPKTTIVIFVSGKLVIVGLQDPECGKQALASLYPVLVQYRVPQRL